MGGWTDRAGAGRAGERERRPVLASLQAVLNYLPETLASAQTEQLRVLFLDDEMRLLADEALAEGSLDEVPIFPRSIMIRALQHGAAAMILVHNHPSGDPQPSPADLDATRRAVAAARTLNLRVHDHVIVARAGASSLCALGLM
jgi:DNA repair protein RadC